MQQVIEDIKDLPDVAVSQAKNTQLYGGIAGLVVGASVGGLYASKVSLNFLPYSEQLTPLVGFLLGAGIYGYGLSGRVKRNEFRSMTQVAGIVIAGANLGKLLASFSLPTFDLATEDADVVGYTGDGRVIGLQAEDMEDGIAAQDQPGYVGDGRVIGILTAEDDESYDYVPDYDATAYNPTMTDTTMGGTPSWSGSATPVALPIYDAAVRAGQVMPMTGSVTQWYGSAEGITHKNTATNVGYNFSMVEGVGSVVGQ